MTGPLDSSQPRAISANAASRVSGSGAAVAMAATSGDGDAAGCARRASASRSAHVQNVEREFGNVSVVARPVATSSSSHARHSSIGGSTTSVVSASCSSSASRTTGHDWAATSAIAAGSRMPSGLVSSRVVRRNVTARARRSWSGASSRNAYGFAFRISCENGEAAAVSTETVRIARLSMPSSTVRRPSRSIAS